MENVYVFKGFLICKEREKSRFKRESNDVEGSDF